MEQLCCPLGIGYDDYPWLLRQYAYPTNPSRRTPDLATSLAGLERAGALPAIDRQLGDKPCCLIQGITSPRNGASLRKFLEARRVSQPNIHAIDIANVAAVFATMNIPLPDVQFSVADAAHLTSFPSGSVQVLVQDHLLNCTPHGTHEGIVREAARVLDPRGFLILNFSVNPSVTVQNLWTRREVAEWLDLSLSDRAYCLSDLTNDLSSRARCKAELIGGIVTLDDAGRSIVITPPQGNFEFYFAREELEERLARHGLQFTFVTSESGVDRNGIRCLRYRTVVRHC